jgi:hypothetical protein
MSNTDASSCMHGVQVTPEDDEEELKDAVMKDMADIFSKVDKGGEGVCVQVRPSQRLA